MGLATLRNINNKNWILVRYTA